MATPQLSPGVLIREVDLTVGRAENVLGNIGAIAGPFVQGPVNEPTDIAIDDKLTGCLCVGREANRQAGRQVETKMPLVELVN